MDDVTAGEYELDGVDVKKLKQKETAKIRNQKFGFIFQAYHLILELNVKENIVVPLGYAGIQKRERAEAHKLLEKFHMTELEKKYISQMPEGEQQRVSVMRAIVNNPQILLADEPTGNLDQENSEIDFCFDIYRRCLIMLRDFPVMQIFRAQSR